MLRYLALLLLPLSLPAQDSLSFGGIYDLPGATVRAKYEPVSPLAKRFTIEEVYRLPSTFYDPARLVALLPGVAQSNDQANHLSVRGNSPNKNLWRINGLAIVNPNHTSNAGTIFDFPSLSGGGVNAISAQMLGNSGFYSGGLPIEYGNAAGGTFDLQLRPGSKEGHRQQLQAGFIGFDVAAEGPIGGRGLSYLVNGRYSFTGLLGDAGVDFGGEEIRFADVNAHLHYQGARSEFSLFGIYGRSANRFRGPDPAEEELEEQKELFDIDFDGELGVLGATYVVEVGRGKLSLGAAISDVVAQRFQSFRGESLSTPALFNQLDDEQISGFVRYNRPLGERFALVVGTEVLYKSLNGRFTRQLSAPIISASQFSQFTNVSPYVGIRMQTDRLTADYGFRQDVYVNSQGRNKSISSPRLAITVPFRRSEVALVAEYFNQAPGSALITPSVESGAFSVAETVQISLAYGREFGKVATRVTAYAQRTIDELAANQDGFLYSANNLLEQEIFIPFDTTADTRRIGLELEAAGGRKDQGLYYRGSLSVFTAQTQQGEEEWSDDRFATEFSAKLTVGREWSGQDRKERPRTLGFNLALIARGGERYGQYPPGEVSADPNDISAYFIQPSYQNGFVNQLGTYFRPDLRLYKTKTRPKTTTTLALDLQNVAGINNAGNVYYDAFLGRAEERSQLGLIPVLSYRLVWR